MPWIGLDLTDPYAARPRDVDVAILDRAGRCAFAALPGGAPRDVARWLREVSRGPGSGDVLAVDGPLALAARGAALRACERLVAAAGKTPDTLPLPGSRPYAGFVRGSVELARGLVVAGWLPIEEGRCDREATLLEVYPGASWTALAGARLPPKVTAAGRRARAELLRANGVRFAREPATHDQLDAALCAWLGRALRAEPARVRVVGEPAWRDGRGHREGAIVVAVASLVARAARPLTRGTPPGPARPSAARRASPGARSAPAP